MDYDTTRPTPGPPDDAEADAWNALLVTYALGAASEDEAATVRTRLADDPEAARLVADFAAVAGVLPELLAEREPLSASPSAALKTRVLAAVAQERQQDQATTERPPFTPAPVRTIQSRRDRGRLRLLSGWLAAAILFGLCLGLFGANIGARHEAADARAVMQVASQSSHAYTMTGTTNAPAANAVLLESPADGGKVVLLTDGFPASAEGQVYRIWVRRMDGTYGAAGTFTCGQQGPTTLVLRGSLAGVQSVIITAEARDQTASRPSGTTVMEGSLV